MPMVENNERIIVEEVSGWLRVFDDGSVDRTWMGPSEVEFLAKPYHPAPEEALKLDGIILHDFTATAPFNLSLRVYIPVDTITTKLPVILHFPGGGFCISRPTWYMYYQFYSRIATACQAIVISVTTRLAPEQRLPAAIDDCYTALLWLRSLARSTGDQSQSSLSDKDGLGLHDKIDFSRVFLMGDSSGGNLVHFVAARAGSEEDRFWLPMKLAGAIAIHPGFVRSYRSKSELEGKDNPFLTLDMVDKFLALALPVGATKDHPFSCPMGDAAPPLESLRLPPMIVVVANDDLIRDTEMEYVEALKKAGKDVELFENNGVGHSFYLNKIAVDHDPCVGTATCNLIDGVKEFLRRH
ncbi:alpha/beta-Hydrolases superfamily protein [Zostera marina]|uniref:Alpha/beta-Hydrolases superfamily protein n=1 Tax=Zostera marina TaxID=29655 RepID=A0A0K9NU85_ZOSMR|nr:alpha/beta-Hydrolases superfamily protein [Zostera marina]